MMIHQFRTPGVTRGHRLRVEIRVFWLVDNLNARRLKHRHAIVAEVVDGELRLGAGLVVHDHEPTRAETWVKRLERCGHVVGRAVTQADDPVAAARALVASLV